MRKITQYRVGKYFFALILMLMAVLLQYLVIHKGNVPVPGILYPMAFLNAWYFGFGPAALTILVSLFFSNFFFYEPRFVFKLLETNDYIRLGIFAVSSVLSAFIVARGKRAVLSELRARSDLKESLDVLETINRVGKNMSAELNHQKLVQQLIDAGTQLTRAQFGAFFYNIINESEQPLTLYSVSGFPIEDITTSSALNFDFTLLGNGIVRSDNITKDHFHNPLNLIAEGQPPIKSYLAIPVTSRTGEVIGGLFFGHRLPSIFTERDERIVTGLASQAAIAMDNARLYDKANQAIKIRDEFLSISSHELKTPLTPLKIQLQSIAKQIDKGLLQEESLNQFKKSITMAEKQVNRITVLVDDLLDVTRITSGKLTLNVEDVDLVETIKEVGERYTTQLQKAQTELKLDLLPSLITKIDRIRFEQVLINLLTNAIKYAPGRPIEISLNHLDNKILLKITDHGEGILPDDQKKVFDRFERANSHAAQGGLGLGLYIVKQIITAHGGTIEVYSQQNVGTTFTIELPMI